MSRKLLPALYRLRKRGLLPERSVLLGVAVETNLNDESFRTRCRDELIAGGVPANELIPRFTGENLFYYGLPSTDTDGFRGLAERIQSIERDKQLSGNRVLYLALPPEAFPTVIIGLGSAGLNHSSGYTRIVIEKPFGHDLESAEQLNECVHKYFDEDQIYRIDHYLGKETVQNILVFRFANSLFEPLWNRDRIASVEITAAEVFGRRASRALLRGRRRASRHDSEPHHAAIHADGDGGAARVRSRSHPARKSQSVALGDAHRRGRRRVRAIHARQNRRHRMFPAIPKSPAWQKIRRQRLSSPCGCGSRIGAGMASHFSCAPESAWRGGPARSS